MANEDRCASCTLCCQLLEVPALKKPANASCANCEEGVGCSIWAERPPICRRFRCLWYPNPQLPAGLRPDLCGAIFEPIRDEKIVIVNVDPRRPEVWRQLGSLVNKLICKYVDEGTAVVVIIGAERHILLPTGIREAEVRAGILRGAQRLGLVA